MPTFQTAKKIAENALKTIGAFPSTQIAPDEGELSDALQWLEMVLNTQSGIRPMTSFWSVIEIPLEAGVADYNLHDYTGEGGVQSVFSMSLTNAINGDPVPIKMMFENEEIEENLSQKGTPTRAIVTKSVKPQIKLYPEPTFTDEQNGNVLRVRLQSFHPTLDTTGNADNDVLLRPSWYLWITKRLAYEIGSGPVRRLADSELKDLRGDADMLEKSLLARDGKQNTGKPPVTEPMAGSYI